jgi:phenylacetate-CoA ligase
VRDQPIQTADHDRHPALSEEGKRLLARLREHPHAPIYRNESGHRLRPHEVEQVRAQERDVMSAVLQANERGRPSWLEAWVKRCYELVPEFRDRGPPPECFEDIPTVDRGDLGRDIARFVPDDVPLERMIHFRTSGTTGHPLLIASHPVVAASYLGYHRRALRRFGVELRHGRGQMGVVLLGHQRVCFTYVSVTPTQDEAGLAKINLHPDDWRHPDDRAPYLDALAPEVLAGDPLSFAVLLDLPVTCRPRALLCTSMTLLPGLRDRLTNRFGCPVLDLYSMNEAGPIAVADPAVGGHVLLQPRMHVEILDPAGRPAPAGQRGEITLTGGFNFCLPLLRYRTGDYASLRTVAGEPVLMGLEGRPPVRFRTRAGAWINNIEVTHLLRPYALARFRLHQSADGTLQFGWDGPGIEGADLKRTLLTLFGADQPLNLGPLAPEPTKQVQYTSDLRGAFP